MAVLCPLYPYGMKSCKWFSNWSMTNLLKAGDDGWMSCHLLLQLNWNTGFYCMPHISLITQETPDWINLLLTHVVSADPKGQFGFVYYFRQMSYWFNLLRSVCLSKVVFPTKNIHKTNADCPVSHPHFKTESCHMGQRIQIQINSTHMDHLECHNNHFVSSTSEWAGLMNWKASHTFHFNINCA